MADIKSLETLLAELRTFIRAINRRLDTGDNSLSKDLLLTPYSVGGKAIMDQVEIARDLGILSRLEAGDLDNEGANYKLERLPGSYATVVLTFYSSTAPTTDVVIPAGTQGQTSGTTFVSPVSFSTVSEARFTVSDADSYFSYDRNRYEFEVTALCDEIGTVGNIGSELVNQLIGSVGGIEGITNLTAATGGLEEEGDDDFRVRIQLAKTGRDLNTVNGIRLYMRTLGFLDAYPVRIEDADAEKATGIDVFVINNSSSAFTETFTYDPSQEKYYLTMRPVLEVTSVVGSNKGTLGASDYDANIDNTSPLRRSIYGQDYLNFSAAAGLLYGETITVQYNYAPLIVQAQENLDLNENNVLTADPLVKRAFPLYLYVNAKLTLKANADGATVRNKVRNALNQWCSTFRMSDDLQKSDLVIILQTGFGDFPVESVDYVVVNSYFLQDELSVVYQPVDEVISVSQKQYVVYGSASIV